MKFMVTTMTKGRSAIDFALAFGGTSKTTIKEGLHIVFGVGAIHINCSSAYPAFQALMVLLF